MLSRIPIRTILMMLLVSQFSWSAVTGACSQDIPSGRHRLLFFDDTSVAASLNLTRRMHQPRKLGAVLKPDPTIGEQWIQIRSAPMWVATQGRYHMAYLSLRSQSSDSLLAYSRDGLNWERPKFDRPGVTPSNRIVVTNPKPKFQETSNIIFDPDDPDPARRFKALVGTEGRLPATSADGLSYHLTSDHVINSSDESQLLYDREQRRFVATLKLFNPYGRAVGLSTSKDFINWTPVRSIFGADEQDQRRAHTVIKTRIGDPAYFRLLLDPEPPMSVKPRSAIASWSADVYDMAVFPYEGIWIGLPAIFYHTGLDVNKTNTDGFHEIQLAYSRDLINWQRIGDRQPFIAASPSSPGVFDRTQLLPTSRPIVCSNELWFYYTGMKWRDMQYGLNRDRTPRPLSEWTPDEVADFKAGSGAVCLAVLRRDGFVSLDAGDESGQLLTKPMTVNGETLYLNLANQDVATVAVLIDGRVTDGLADSDCVPIKGDSVEMAVRWHSANLQQIRGKSVQFRITYRKGSLYSLWLGP